MLTIEDLDRMTRWGATTRTWIKKMCALLPHDAGNTTSGAQRAVIGYHAGDLLSTALYELDVLVALIPDDAVRECEVRAKELHRMLRNRRLVAALSETAGRTPAETATFREKAATLR